MLILLKHYYYTYSKLKTYTLIKGLACLVLCYFVIVIFIVNKVYFSSVFNWFIFFKKKKVNEDQNLETIDENDKIQNAVNINYSKF